MKIRLTPLFQCDGFLALEHRSDEEGRKTACGLRPSQEQWNSGSISFDHDIKSMAYQCQTCLPAVRPPCAST